LLPGLTHAVAPGAGQHLHTAVKTLTARTAPEEQAARWRGNTSPLAHLYVQRPCLWWLTHSPSYMSPALLSTE
jgi:hypothetical protein